METNNWIIRELIKEYEENNLHVPKYLKSEIKGLLKICESNKTKLKDKLGLCTLSYLHGFDRLYNFIGHIHFKILNFEIANLWFWSSESQKSTEEVYNSWYNPRIEVLTYLLSII